MEPDEVPNELVSDAYLDKMERVVLNADSADPPTLPNTPDRRRVHDNFTLAAISEIRSLREWVASLESALAAREAEVAELREALYPLVVGCLTADANEDAPEFVNDEAYVGRRALPECGRCCGSGSTDGTEYVDVAIPEALRCPDCGGWGFLKSAPGSSDALRAVVERAVRAGLAAVGHDDGSLFYARRETSVSAIVSRLLGDARGETPRVDAEREGDANG